MGLALVTYTEVLDMNSSNHTLGRIDASRCSVCRHPDREALDRDLILKRLSQSEVARRVGVDRSTVSRHVKNHVVPALAQGILMDTKDIAIGSLTEAFDRNYAESQSLYERAVQSGNLRLAASLLNHQLRLLETVVRYASKMGQATLQDVIGRDPAADLEYHQGIKKDLLSRLDLLAERHERGIVRPEPIETAESGEGVFDDEPDV